VLVRLGQEVQEVPRRLSTLDIETPHGPARAHLHPADESRAALVLGHGAGGGVEAGDLVAAKDAALSQGVSVALIEQPFRVAGRRSPAPARQLDAAWIAVVERLGADELGGLGLIVGGRSLGARVACRTVGTTGALAVLCLAFPLQPPPRKGGKTSPSRLGELEEVAVPMLIVQGDRDRFGMPPAARGRTVAQVPGDHGLKKDLDAVRDAVAAWLPSIAAAAPAAS
jgi:predicted alpha/beta-hydrolase family hydrolase